MTNYKKVRPLDLIFLFTKTYHEITNAEKGGFNSTGIWRFDKNIFEQLTEDESNKSSQEFISSKEAVNVEKETRGELENDLD